MLRGAASNALAIALLAGQQGSAERRGSILKWSSPTSPASMSPIEEAAIIAEMPTTGLFNNLIRFDQHIPQVILETIRPDGSRVKSLWELIRSVITRLGLNWPLLSVQTHLTVAF